MWYRAVNRTVRYISKSVVRHKLKPYLVLEMCTATCMLIHDGEVQQKNRIYRLTMLDV
jgi:hypothetical protein